MREALMLMQMVFTHIMVHLFIIDYRYIMPQYIMLQSIMPQFIMPQFITLLSTTPLLHMPLLSPKPQHLMFLPQYTMPLHIKNLLVPINMSMELLTSTLELSLLKHRLKMRLGLFKVPTPWPCLMVAPR